MLLGSVSSGLVPARAQDEGAVELVREARQHLAGGDPAQALPLLLKAKAEIEARDPSAVALAFVDDDIASTYVALGEPALSLPHAVAAVERISSAEGRDSLNYGLLLSTLAAAELATGRVRKAIESYQESSRILDRNGGPAERRVRVARSLARAYATAEQTDEATAAQETAMQLASATGYCPPANAYAEKIANCQAMDLELVHVLIESRQLDRAAATIQSLRIPTNGSVENDGVDLLRLRTALLIARGELSAANEILESTSLQRKAESLSLIDRIGLLNQQSYVYVLLGRVTEAQAVYRRLLLSLHDVVAADHPAVAKAMHGLAVTYQAQGEYEESAAVYERALAALSRVLGPDSRGAARVRLEFSRALTRSGDLVRGEQEARAAITSLLLAEKVDQEGLGFAKSALGFALKARGDTEGAIAAFVEATNLIAAAAGNSSPDLPPGFIALAELYLDAMDLDRAGVALSRANEILDSNSIDTFDARGKAIVVGARLTDELGRTDEALANLASLLDVAAGHANRALSSSATGEFGEAAELFEEFVEIGMRHPSPETYADMFIAAQYPGLTTTAATISAVAARFSAQDSQLGELLDQQQRLVADRTDRMARLEEALSGRADLTQSGPLATEIERLTERIERAAARISSEYPDFANLAFPRPVTVPDVQGLLAGDEALLQMMVTDDACHLFLITTEGVSVRTTNLDKATLDRLVRRVRQSVSFDADRGLPPFALEEAHELYRGLIEPFVAELGPPASPTKRYIVFIPDGAMTSLPPALLVTRRAPASAGPQAAYSNVDFLGKAFELAIVPSASSFVALRSLPAQSADGAIRMIGFGDPILGAGTNVGEDATSRTLEFGAVADVHSLLKPLGNTTVELTAMAAALSVPDPPIFLRDRATESNLRQLKLDDYQVVVFATHGLVRDENLGLMEPALVLTKDEQNDGLLTASEISALSLKADWVILSACNTAATDGTPRAAGLSGLAKSFFFAGTRALMVSHWEIDSYATVLLTTGALEEYADSPGARSRSLQAASRRLLDGRYGDEYTHPAYWAPFVVVGEGRDSARQR